MPRATHPSRYGLTSKAEGAGLVRPSVGMTSMGPSVPHVCDRVTVTVSGRYCSFSIAGCLDFSTGHIWGQITLRCWGAVLPSLDANSALQTPPSPCDHHKCLQTFPRPPVEACLAVDLCNPQLLPTDGLLSVCPAFSLT